MQAEKIKNIRSEIPISRLGFIPTDEQIFETNDGGAHCKATRHDLVDWLGFSCEMLALSISGKISERQRVREEFTEVLGQPSSEKLDIWIDNLAWLYIPSEDGEELIYIQQK